ARATRGADRVLAMVPPNYGHLDQRAWGKAAADAIASGTQVSRVKTVVTLSSVGADLEDGVGGQLGGLHELEHRFNIIPGINLLHVRCGFFMENLLSSIPLIRNAGINGGMFDADRPIPMIATRDISSRLAEYLGRQALSGKQVIELPGPRDYTHRQVTGVIGTAIGRPDLPYVRFSYEDGINALRNAGLSESAAVGFAEMARGFNEERIRRAPRSPETTTPTTIEDFIRDVFLPAWHYAP
ncbi:MAG TPA: hypothetical protein VG817_08135, partial [Gemmatimonadales bacterium]|nr:hypothetical protein [Gemmatimonadales bacterium]